jgi:ATP-dependent RNA helicase DDX46/PRP5
VINKNITQCVEVLKATEKKDIDDVKFTRLIQLIGYWYDKGNILIFVDKKETCENLLSKLLKTGYEVGFCTVLHGNLDQDEREAAISDFKKCKSTVMIATAVAGRGLDVPETKAVINYTTPNHFEDYIHLCGRTGRGNNKGYAYTFITPADEKYAPLLVKALRQGKQEIASELQELSDTFIKKVETGTAKWAKSGYSTKGYKFDESEDLAAKSKNEERKKYEIEMGLRIEGEDEDINEFTTTATTTPTSSTSNTKDKDNKFLAIEAKGNGKASGEAREESGKKEIRYITMSGEDGKTINIDINAIQERARQQAKSSLQKAKPTTWGQSSTSATSQTTTKNTGSKDIRILEVNGIKKYIYERNINNLPDDIRAKLTRKATLDKLQEVYTRLVSVLVRGEYNGKKPLHLLIEGREEADLIEVKKGLDKFIQEQLQSTNLQNTGGKFTVFK